MWDEATCNSFALFINIATALHNDLHTIHSKASANQFPGFLLQFFQSGLMVSQGDVAGNFVDEIHRFDDSSVPSFSQWNIIWMRPHSHLKCFDK